MTQSEQIEKLNAKVAACEAAPTTINQPDYTDPDDSNGEINDWVEALCSQSEQIEKLNAHIEKLNAKVAAYKSALESIRELDYTDSNDADGEINEWAEAVCFNKAQSIANIALTVWSK